MSTTKAVLLSLTSAILAFNVGTHMETSKVARIKLANYTTCAKEILMGDRMTKELRVVVALECGELL